MLAVSGDWIRVNLGVVCSHLECGISAKQEVRGGAFVYGPPGHRIGKVPSHWGRVGLTCVALG